MTELNPLAQNLAEKLSQAAPEVLDLLSAYGRSIYFPKGILTQSAEAGAKAVIQPGGSIHDEEVIKAADDAGLAMVFTAMRHFRH